MFHHLAVAEDGIHVLQNWEVADEAARLALTVAAEDVGKVCKQEDINKFYVLEATTPTWGLIGTSSSLLSILDVANYYATDDLESVLAALGKALNRTVIDIACGDETTAIATGVKVTFRIQHGFKLSSIRGSLTTAQATGGTKVTVDVKQNGTTLFTTKPTFDNTEKTTATASAPSVLNIVDLVEDDEVTIEVTAIGDGTAKGLKMYLVGKIV